MLHIAPEDPSSPAAAQLVADLSRDMNDRFPDRDSRRDDGPTPGAEAARSVFLVAWFGGDAMGCGALRAVDESTAEIHHLYVVPTLRGRGIGSEILRDLERHAEDRGFTHLCLEAGDRQPEAVALSRASGFAPIPPYWPHQHAPHITCYGKAVARQRSSHHVA